MAQSKVAVIRSDLDIVIARTLARDTAKQLGFGAIDQAQKGRSKKRKNIKKKC